MTRYSFYGVRSGRRRGVFRSWDAYQQSVWGYSGAESRGFDTRWEAQEYVEEADDDSCPRYAVLKADGAARSNPHGPSGAGGSLSEWNADGSWVSHLASYRGYLGVGSNNAAEYRSLIAGLRKALRHGVTHLTAKMDSELVVRQMSGDYKVRSATLLPLWRTAQGLSQRFAEFQLLHIPRAFNQTADRLANLAIDEYLNGDY